MFFYCIQKWYYRNSSFSHGPACRRQVHEYSVFPSAEICVIGGKQLLPVIPKTTNNKQQTKNHKQQAINNYRLFLLPHYRQHHFPAAAVVPVFTEIDSLPGAQVQVSISDGNLQRGIQ